MSPSHIDLSRLPKPSESDCRTTREILDLVGDKWSLYVVGTLSGGSRRFNELKREIEGISQRMLTLTLRGLERDGLVTRTVFPSILRLPLKNVSLAEGSNLSKEVQKWVIRERGTRWSSSWRRCGWSRVGRA
ncbi:winged helix-turn-helix transcriptional regulator [Ralstonia solanacearum]|uniref:winged helix-turn-helix transcriptional regulator n=1 Tax=Ralstonia solanacearum TaxID=305 RepID=UPI003D68AC93